MKRTLLVRHGVAGAWVLLSMCAASTAIAQSSSYALLTPGPGLAFVVDGPATSPSPVIPITGVIGSDVLVAIDVRPQNGRLYALGQDPKQGTVRLYILDTNGVSVQATPLALAGSFVDAGGAPIPILAQSFDIDFNPTVDRLRVVASNGLNFRMNPNNGLLVDGNLGSASPVTGVNPDGNLTGGAGGVMGTAYTNNAINVAITTQYTLDHRNDTLYIQNPPNAGTLTAPVPITRNGSSLDFSAVGGFDIEPGINASASNMPAAGQAAAALTAAGQARLYRINLADGVATEFGNLGGLTVVDLAVYNLPATVNTLSLSGTQLTRFPFATPGTAAQATVTGVAMGERLVGFDVRPATGQLYALGINAAADTGTIYMLEPQSAGGTAVATAVGAPGSIAYVDAAGVPVDLSDLPAGFDFNPVVDRIRIVDASGLNARANPNDGMPVDGNTGAAGINPDTEVQADLGTQLVGTAYTSNVIMAAFTTQYTLDQTFARLYIQNPPNGGVQTIPQALTLTGAPFEFRGDTGFDIPPGVNAASANAVALGRGYFTANSPADAPAFYELNLADGVVQPLGDIASNGLTQTGLAVYNAPVEVAFAADSVSVDESNVPATINIVLVSGASVPVRYSTSDGTAIAGEDYAAVQGTVFLNGSEPVASIQIPILTDQVEEGDETFTVTLDGPFPQSVTLTVTIRADGDLIFSDGFEGP